MRRTVALAMLVGVVVASAAGHDADPLGHPTTEQTVVKGPVRDPARPGFFDLVAGPGSPYVVRRLGETVADPGRAERRRSLAYFAQLTDFQLADEESPARVELVDRGASSAWRPMEAFAPHAIDLSLRQVNAFADASPVKQGDGTGAPMNFALITGDNSDNQQRNETVWVRQLIEGGTIDPNSGTRIDDYAACGPVLQQALLAKGTPPEPTYTGVQDYADYFQAEDFYDPNQPSGQWADWPRYRGLMDRAQLPFHATGLKVPSYLTNGNHDGLVQGNEDANREFERIATGCIKAVTTTSNPPFPSEPSPSFLLSPGVVMPVPPDDPGRAFVDKVELKKIYSEGSQSDDHGFAYVDPAELEASGYSASYYAWDARPGMRFVSIDTLSEGGVVGEDPTHASPINGSSNGNIDDPQWKWLERELEAASAADKIIVVFGHHPVRSLTSSITDEMASPCTGRYDGSLKYGGQTDEHGHDPNPGCDLDPRSSSPIHDGEDLAALLTKYPHVVAYVAGHTHENKILPFAAPSGGTGFWEINTSATADWPQQHRLVEVFDNRDGTLSLFGTVLDHGSPLATPPDTDDAAVSAAFSTEVLAGLARTFSYNDPQASRAEGDSPGAEGTPEDRNVELLVPDPRRSRSGGGGSGGSGGGGAGGGGGGAGSACARAAAFSRASVRARGSRSVRFRFARRVRGAARIDVAQHARGRRILRRPRVVARFRNRLVGFRWNGRATRGGRSGDGRSRGAAGRRLRDGVYLATLRAASDTRRFTLLRRRGRWFAVRGHRRRPGCGTLRSASLGRPVFRRTLRISFRLNRRARVRVTVLRGRRAVRRFRAATRRPGVTHRLLVRGLRRGAYRVRITAGRRTVTLLARRL
ncbi:MAG TPA: hypothetical protein VF529_06700 [Solirubrobacteraceae bacterium]